MKHCIPYSQRPFVSLCLSLSYLPVTRLSLLVVESDIYLLSDLGPNSFIGILVQTERLHAHVDELHVVLGGRQSVGHQ